MSGESQAPAQDHGESADGRGRGSVQPGGREPAPGDLSLVQAFINTHYDLEVNHGAELLATPASARRWMSGHGLLAPTEHVSAEDLIRLRTVREALRALAAANGAGLAPPAAIAEINAAAQGAAVELRFEAKGPRFLPADPGEVDGALGLLLAITARAMIDGAWSRLKVCPGEDCGWAFYDHSRNQTGRWCSMSVCGGRAKARAHYRRRRRESG